MYIKNESKRKQIETLCDKMAIAVKQLKPADLNKTIGSLAGIKGINGSKSVELCNGSCVTGDIHTSRIRIADNVEFEGEVSMIEGDVDIFSVASSEYKNALLMKSSEAR